MYLAANNLAVADHRSGNQPAAHLDLAADLAWSVLEELDYGLILVSPEAWMQHANHLARQELARSRFLRSERGQICGVHPSSSAEILRAIQAAARGRRQLLELQHGGEVLPVACVPLFQPCGGEAVSVLLMLARQRGTQNLAVTFFARSHGLTSAEEAVLRALREGLQVDEIAAAHGVCISTIRTQIPVTARENGCSEHSGACATSGVAAAGGAGHTCDGYMDGRTIADVKLLPVSQVPAAESPAGGLRASGPGNGGGSTVATTRLQELAARGSVRSFRRGVMLIQEGDRGDTIFIVQAGRLRAYAADPSGKEVTLGIYGPGEYVGEMALDGGPRSANVETLTNTTCAVVTREMLLDFIAGHPDFALEIMARLIRRARLATESARSMALIDVYGRLARLLDQLAGPPAADGSRKIAERLTHREIASHLACSREMVSRLMKDLETGGYLRTQEQRISLVRPLPARW